MPQDLLERGFYGIAPNRRWVADMTYVPVVAADFVYTAFVMDLFARRILGWQVTDHLQADRCPRCAGNGDLDAAAREH